MRDIAVSILFTVTALLALTRVWLGVLLWAWLDYMSPQMLCYGFAASIPWVVIVAAVTGIAFLTSSGPKGLPFTRETMILLVFMVWMTFTTFFALNSEETWGAWSTAMKIQVFTIAILCTIRTPKHLTWLIWVVAASIGYYGVRGGIGAILSGGVYRIYGPDNTYIADNNDLALALVTILPLLRYLQLRTEKRILRIGLGLVIAFTLLSVIASYSRAGLLALGVVVVALIFKSRRRLVLGFATAVILVLSLRFMPDQWFQRMSTITEYSEDSSAQQRLNSWTVAWNLAVDRPIVGGGFRAFTPELYAKYAPVQDYHEAHSIFLKVLAEHGFPGLLLFLSLGFFSWRSARWVIRTSRADPELQWAGDLASMIQVSLLGYCVGGAFSNLAYFDLPYTLMAITVLCKVWIKERPTREDRANVSSGLSELAPA